MATIVKPDKSSPTGSSQSDRGGEPRASSSEVESRLCESQARVIKASPGAGDGPTPKRTASAEADRSDIERAEARPAGADRLQAINGGPGKIRGAKIGNHASGHTGLVEFNFDDLAEQGREQIQRCREQVDAMLDEARQQAEALKQNAKVQGHAEGIQAAQSEVEQQVNREADAKAKAQVESLHQAVVQMKQQYDSWMRQYAEVLTSTAIAAAERLTRSQIVLPNLDGASEETPTKAPLVSPADVSDADRNEHLLVRWAREALHSTRSASRLTLAVHPDTLAHLGKPLDELLAHPDLPEESVVIPDETLAVGDIVVRQNGGEISAGLDAQLARLREELM